MPRLATLAAAVYTSSLALLLPATTFVNIALAEQLAIAPNFGNFPLGFEPPARLNRKAKFLARGDRYSVSLTSSADLLVHYGDSQTVRVGLVGGNPQPRITPMDELPGRINYYLGSDPAMWRSGVPTYRQVRFSSVYPGIDVIFYGNQRQLEFDFVVHPRADWRAIEIAYEGASRLQLTSGGDLLIDSPTGRIEQCKPVIYQVESGTRKEIEGEYELKRQHNSTLPTVRFRIGSYNRRLPLIIDPVLIYSTYLGGSRTDGRAANDRANRIAVDSAGNAYITGFTNSTNFPTMNPVQSSYGSLNCGISPGNAPCSDAFVTKLNASGTALVYSTYLGGSTIDRGNDVVVDSSGNAYVTGSTTSDNFPTTPGALKTAGSTDAFVVKLDSTGALVYSTRLGGSGTIEQSGNGTAIDADGNAYVAGTTDATDFPVVNAFDATAPGGLCNKFTPSVRPCTDAFVSKLNPAGSALVYSTYLGTFEFDDVGRRIAVDVAGNAYVIGQTKGSTFPTANPFQAASGGGEDAFVTKLGPAGNTLVYSTYLGGSATELIFGIAVDSAGNVYVQGTTGSANFPTTPGAFQTTFQGVFDGFITKLTVDGAALSYSSFLGGLDVDSGGSLAIDSTGIVYLTGSTGSANFPVTMDAIQTSADCNIFKTTTSGATWSCANAGFPVGQTVRAIAIDPTNSQIVYAAAGNPSVSPWGVYKSTDGGATWSSASNGLPNAHILGLAIDPVNPTTVYAGVPFYGVYKTTTGGTSWAITGNLVSGGERIVVDPSNSANVYTCTSGGVFKSTNAGVSWTNVLNRTCKSLEIDPSSSMTLYAGDSGSIVSKTTNGGTSWTLSFLPCCGAINGVNGIAIHPTNSSIIFAAGNGGVFLSTDGAGAGLWANKSTGLNDTNVTALIVDPANGSQLFAATNGGGIFKTTNGANSWSPGNTGLLNRSIQALVIDRVNTPTLFAGATGGGGDAYVAKFDFSKLGAEALIYSSFLGGSGSDSGSGIAVDSAGNIYVAGATGSTNFPTKTPFQAAKSGAEDGFVTKISFTAPLFARGDVNGDATVTVADIFYLINFLFSGGAQPVGSGDTNNDGPVTVADVVFLINYLFAGGPAPAL